MQKYTGTNYIYGKAQWSILLFYLAFLVFGNYIILDLATFDSVKLIIKQAIFSITSVGFLVIAFSVPLAKIREHIYKILIAMFIVLILVLIVGRKVNGARRYLPIGPFTIQPSIFAKLILITYFAHILDKFKERIQSSKSLEFFIKFSIPIMILIYAIILIILEKHLSVLIILTSTVFCMLWLAGVNWKSLVLIVALGIIGVIGIISFGSSYRSMRINMYKKYTLFNPNREECKDMQITGELQIKESVKAISNGGLFGKDRPVAKYNFVSYVKNDYVFAYIGEKYGFFISGIFILLYFVFFLKCAVMSNNKHDLFLKLLGIGLSLNIFINFLVNIGVALSALPCTGVTLPFISSGGSSMLANSISIGILINISQLR